MRNDQVVLHSITSLAWRKAKPVFLWESCNNVLNLVHCQRLTNAAVGAYKAGGCIRIRLLFIQCECDAYQFRIDSRLSCIVSCRGLWSLERTHPPARNRFLLFICNVLWNVEESRNGALLCFSLEAISWPTSVYWPPGCHNDCERWYEGIPNFQSSRPCLP